MKKYIQENIETIIKFGMICVAGILLGIIMYSFADSSYIDIIKNIFDQSKNEDFNGINILVNGLKNNVIYVGVCYLTLMFIYTPLALLFLIILKCTSIGIYMCSIFSLFGFSKGIICVLVGVILPDIFCLFGYILISTNILDVYKRIKEGTKIRLYNGINFVYILLISISLISFSIVIEQLSSSIMLNLYNKI